MHNNTFPEFPRPARASIVAHLLWANAIHEPMKKIRRIPCQWLLFPLLMMLLFTQQSGAAVPSCERDIIEISSEQPAPDLSNLVAALSGKMTDQSVRINTLEDAIKTAPRTPAEMLLQDRARLYLSAMDIRQQHFDKARERLKLINTGSPVAAEAGLLIAESWRLEENHDEALKWFLRVGRHFSDDINALHGLLRAAESMQESGRPREAAALYNEVVDKALGTVKRLDSLPQDQDARVNAVFSRQQPMPSALRQKITSEMLRDTADLAQTRQVYRETSREWHCLLEQQQRLALQSERIHQHSDRLAQASTLVDESMAALETEISTLEKQMVSEDFSATQLAIRKRLGQARNERTRLLAQRDFIARTQGLLPQAISMTEQKLEAMTASFSEIRGQASQDLYDAAQKAIDATAATFRNLAGDSQRRLAEMQMQQASQP